METLGAPRLRLLFVTSGLTRGGAEGFLVRLVPRLAARGHDCVVATFGAHPPLASPLEATGIEVVRLGDVGPSAFLRLVRCTRRFRPQVVQGWMYRGNLAALAAARVARGRPAVVWSVRQGLNDLSSSPWATRLAVAAGARLSRRPFAIVYNAHTAAQQHASIGFGAARSPVIPNGIDVPRTMRDEKTRTAARARFGLAGSAFVVAFAARWHPVKNHRGFARAASILARRRPEARFLLAGSGIDASNGTLAACLREEELSDHVVLLGELADLSDLLAAADLATLASHGEALPNAILEAMAAGVPCVAPDVGDVAALVGDTGVVVRADDPSALAAGWDELAAMTRDARAALGERARSRVAERYGLDRAAEAFESLYRAASA